MNKTLSKRAELQLPVVLNSNKQGNKFKNIKRDLYINIHGNPFTPSFAFQ